MFPEGFETTILASKQSQTHDLERTATGTGDVVLYKDQFYPWFIELAILLLDVLVQEFNLYRTKVTFAVTQVKV
jgi:hypothetical protein